MNNENNQENNLDPFGRDNERSSFSGKLGYVLAVAGSAVGLGNIWRFPYLAAKYGGGIFLLVYLILMLTFGYVLIVSETTLGRLTRKSPVGAFNAFGKSLPFKIGGWINAVIPMLIIPYYSVIGGWVFKYLFEYLRGSTDALAEDSYFTGFITAGASVEVWFLIFTLVVLLIIVAGVEHGIEKVSKMMMPVLVILAIIVSIYSVTRPGAFEGVKYFLIPNFDNFSWMTIVAAMGQMFYSLSIAMGILYTYGSYMKKDVDIEQSTSQIEVFDTAIAFLAGLMIIPAVFSFFNGDPEKLKAGPSLMFITLPKVFASMGMGRIIGVVFFLLVLLAALTSAISLAESCVSTLEDQLGWKRNIASVVIGIVIVILGSFSALGFGMLDFVQILGMSILDFFDFLTNSLMMPIAALSTCILIVYVVGVDKIVEEVETSSKFKRKGIYKFFIKYLAPICILVILVSSIASVFGLIKF
jgi:transporter